MKTITFNGLEIFNETGRKYDWTFVVPCRDLERSRVRWGSLEEIKGDVDHFVTYGSLLKVAGQSWA